MFKKILFATTASPGCDAAAKIAFELAEKYECELILFHVFTEPSQGGVSFARDDVAGGKSEIAPGSHELIKKVIENIYGVLIQKHKEPRYEIAIGTASTQILGYARKNEVDCIIMGAPTKQDDMSAARFRGIVGETMQKVTLGARCPVSIISRPCETCFWYFNQIVLGTDFSTASMSAFQFAYKMADFIGCKLHLFHALNIETSQAGVAPGQKSIEAKIKEAKAKIERLYVSRMKNFENYEISVWEGTPYVELLKFARETSGDLIVMAHHTKEIMKEAVMGSTMEQVVLRSACPVVSVSRQMETIAQLH